jgi:hypothetical protein
MNIQTTRLEVEQAFENAETISDFKMRVHNIITDIYFYNDITKYADDYAKFGYRIDMKTGELTNQ